jgi:hypothetical protein
MSERLIPMQEVTATLPGGREVIAHVQEANDVDVWVRVLDVEYEGKGAGIRLVHLPRDSVRANPPGPLSRNQKAAIR